MVDRCCRLRLAHKPCGGIVVLCQVRREEFESDGPVQLGVAGFIDDTHSASTQFRKDLVVSTGFTDHLISPFRLHESRRSPAKPGDGFTDEGRCIGGLGIPATGYELAHIIVQRKLESPKGA